MIITQGIITHYHHIRPTPFRIMASLAGRSNPGLYGSSRLKDIKEGWFWGMLDVFGSRRNTKRVPDAKIGKMQQLMWTYKDRNGLEHEHTKSIYKDRLDRRNSCRKYYTYLNEDPFFKDEIIYLEGPKMEEVTEEKIKPLILSEAFDTSIYKDIIAERVFNIIESFSAFLDIKDKEALFETCIGFIRYWVNFLENPRSWQFDNGDDSDKGAMSMMLSMMGRKSEYSYETISTFIERIIEVISGNLNKLFDNGLGGTKEIDSIPNFHLANFSVDYYAYGELGEICNDLSEINMNTFPCKTSSLLVLKNIEFLTEGEKFQDIRKDGIIKSWEPKAWSSQGYRAEPKEIGVDGKLILPKTK